MRNVLLRKVCSKIVEKVKALNKKITKQICPYEKVARDDLSVNCFVTHFDSSQSGQKYSPLPFFYAITHSLYLWTKTPNNAFLHLYRVVWGSIWFAVVCHLIKVEQFPR